SRSSLKDFQSIRAFRRHSFGGSVLLRAIPGKVRSGFPSGIAGKQRPEAVDGLTAPGAEYNRQGEQHHERTSRRHCRRDRGRWQGPFGRR
ncbi:MAG: hypothetical protein E5W57_12910, partial [Mesorhizobium sp.]